MRKVADEGARWQRLHPATPLLHGWRALLLVAAGVGQQGLRGARGPGRPELGLLVVAVAVAAGLVALVVWRTTRFRLTDTELQVDSGVLRRRSRRVPLARVQAVDLVRPLAARVLGLAELRLDMVGGSRAEAPLAYLREGDARLLRARLLVAAAGPPRAATGPAPAPDLVLVAVPTGTLLAAALLGAPATATALLALGLAGAAAVHPAVLPELAAAVLPLYIGTLAVAGRRVLAEYGFAVTELPTGLRLRHGLLDIRSQTIPLGRVQSIRLLQPLLWRPFGWVRVEVDVAGHGARGEQREATRALLPVAPLGLAQLLVGRVLGGPLPVPAAPVPRRAGWRAPLSRRRLRAGLDARHLVVTSGVLTLTTDVVPLRNVQGLRLTSGPWQRALRLTTVHVDTAGRRLPSAQARHRDAGEARQLLETLTGRARAARQQDRSPSAGRSARADPRLLA